LEPFLVAVAAAKASTLQTERARAECADGYPQSSMFASSGGLEATNLYCLRQHNTTELQNEWVYHKKQIKAWLLGMELSCVAPVSLRE